MRAWECVDDANLRMVSSKWQKNGMATYCRCKRYCVASPSNPP
jgi:hypothetical protein